MDDMLKDFVIEALELSNDVEDRLLQLERRPDDPEAINAVFRSFHTIKGGAGFLNLSGMVSACHLTENLFDAIRTGTVKVTPLAIDAALQASGFVADLLHQLNAGVAPEELPEMPVALEQALTAAVNGSAVAVPSAVAATPAVSLAEVVEAVTDSGWEIFDQAYVSDPADPVDWLAYFRAVSGSADMVQAPAPAPAKSVDVAPPPSSPAKTVTADPAAPAAPAAPVAAPAPATGWDGVDRRKETAEESIRVDAHKLDALLEVAGESVQAANQASVLLEKLQQFKFEGAAATLMSTLSETLGRASRYAGELQRATLATRMQPVGRLFQKFPRLVRELARELGKEVDLVIEGAETEVDRVVVDSLYEPLVHMLRNSLDHGIEHQAERVAAGKPTRATIMLKAWQEANSVMIVVSDDGRGLDPERIRAKALGNGLIEANAQISDQEAFHLIFRPGFSTKEVASSVSGRGVGMDVVKTAVEKHRGTIGINSTMGCGTRFSIRLPIEMSIVPMMLVRASGAALGLPLALVDRVVELPADFEGVGGAPILRNQGQNLPVRSLAENLGYEAGQARVGVVIAAPTPYVLTLDAVDGTADLVIKPLTSVAACGISGTTRSAEGELVLVVGLAFLLNGAIA
ncbi:chemotaxis protein CheA [Noviherbaspirillum pedocola]|uniref:Chemotaxis protein CheA n=1 Tax=Noviherbaspirillum pedocola TaxID=2801341 RepID=A0A934SSS0_9BURK|nr:chemotaxis protein CheA [Noviherbaspirillum pedocola]MBK4736096.1 chemotaxis protein CheA [Noviherbaspirillum pedocola]